MDSLAKKNKGLKTEPEIKDKKKKSSLNKKSIENIPEINSAFFDNSLDAMMIGSQDGQIYTANRAACRMLGFSEKEIRRLGRAGIVKLTPQLSAAISKRRKQGNFFGELTFIRKDGSRIPVEVTSTLFTHSDGRELTTLIMRDITERKKTEEDLYESGEKYRLLMESSGLGIGYYDLNGKILMFNREALRNLGGKAQDYIGRNIKDVFGEEAGQLYIDRLKLVAESGKSLKFEDKVEFSGRPGWYLSTHTRILDQNGVVEGIQVIADNITEIKLTEEKLKMSETEYRNLFENSIIGISQAMPGGKFIRINKAYAEMYGYPDTSTLLKELSNGAKMLYSNPDDRKMVLDTLEKNGYLPPTEFELNRRNGEKFWALVSAKKFVDSYGNLLYLQAEHIDITNQKKLEKERFITSVYARNLIEASLDPLVTISKEGKITDVNLATERITGVPREKLIGSDFADYFTRPDNARRGYKKVFSDGIVRDYPLTIRNTSGRETEVLYNAALFKNEDGEVQGVFAAARDITAQKKLEKELQRSHKLLEKLNQHLLEVRENERSQIALNLHDDLGQKLTAINLDIAWLKCRIGVQSKPVREKLEDMSLMIKESVESIREISSFLRPGILFDLGLVTAINNQLKNFEKQTGIKCIFNCDPQDIVLDESISIVIFRILQESLTNIARHSGATETVVALKRTGTNIKVMIKDNGIGIDKDKINSISSLGIAGIKERIKSIDGKIIIGSEKGAGMRIKIVIPVKTKTKND